MRKIRIAVISQLLIFGSWARANSDACSKLLQKMISETQAVNSRNKPRITEADSQTREWGIGTGRLKVSYREGSIALEGLKEPLSISEKLTPEQLERFKTFTEKRADRFDFNFDPNSNRSALKEGVNYARLHEAFYGRASQPLEAARELESLIKRSARINPNVKVKIRETQTTQKFLENVGTMADKLDSVRELHKTGKLEQALKDYQDHKNQEEGTQVLDQMLNPEPSVDMEQIIQKTETRQRGQSPDALQLEVDFSHDEPLRVHLERSIDGKLKIIPQGKPGFTIKTLKQLVEWLQGQGFDHKSYDWRTYEEIENLPF